MISAKLFNTEQDILINAVHIVSAIRSCHELRGQKHFVLGITLSTGDIITVYDNDQTVTFQLYPN